MRGHGRGCAAKPRAAQVTAPVPTTTEPKASSQTPLFPHYLCVRGRAGSACPQPRCTKAPLHLQELRALGAPRSSCCPPRSAVDTKPGPSRRDTSTCIRHCPTRTPRAQGVEDRFPNWSPPMSALTAIGFLTALAHAFTDFTDALAQAPAKALVVVVVVALLAVLGVVVWRLFPPSSGGLPGLLDARQAEPNGRMALAADRVHGGPALAATRRREQPRRPGPPSRRAGLPTAGTRCPGTRRRPRLAPGCPGRNSALTSRRARQSRSGADRTSVS